MLILRSGLNIKIPEMACY